MIPFEIVVMAAQLGKDLPSDPDIIAGITNSIDFNAQNPAYTYDVWEKWVADGLHWLLERLPATLIKKVYNVNVPVSDVGVAILPDISIVRILRVAVEYKPYGKGWVGARYKNEDYWLGIDQNIYLKGTKEYPIYTLYSEAGFKKQIRFSPIGEGKCAIIGICWEEGLLSVAEIDAQYHYLIAKCAAREKLLINGDENALVMQKEIEGELAYLEKKYQGGWN